MGPNTEPDLQNLGTDEGDCLLYFCDSGPSVAGLHLIMSEDVNSVRYRERQPLPENPEITGFRDYACVWGSGSFSLQGRVCSQEGVHAV